VRSLGHLLNLRLCVDRLQTFEHLLSLELLQAPFALQVVLIANVVLLQKISFDVWELVEHALAEVLFCHVYDDSSLACYGYRALSDVAAREDLVKPESFAFPGDSQVRP